MRECPECGSALPATARLCHRCGAAAGAAAHARDPWIGRTFAGKFRVEAVVGQGGMGRVYRARHLGLDRTVALKLLHRAYSTDPEIAQRLQREARAAARLDHPNSIAVLDFGAAGDGTLFMAMEYLGGRDLARLLAEEFPLGEDRIVRIGAQILSALAEAHARGIVHRDLKPENVMVEPRRGEPDFVKVLDFGIAKISAPGADEPRLTLEGLVCGTPEYVSPEQARGADLDARSDLYSAGVILYQLATGALPFDADTPMGFLTKHLSEPPVPARERNPALSPALEAVIARALEKDPGARFQSADEMREALLACAAPVDPTPSEVAGGEGSRRARPFFWVFAAAMVLAVLGGGGIALLGRARVAQRRGHPDTIAPAQTGAGATGAADAPTPAPAIAPVLAAPEPAPSAAPSGGPAPAPAPDAAPAAMPVATATPAAKPSRRDRGKAQALYRKAEARRAAHDLDHAIELYLQAEAADPGLAEIQKRLGLCYQQKGDGRRAAERYRRYLATGPADAERVRAILATLR
jgi:serine/threonine-protein kinase